MWLCDIGVNHDQIVQIKYHVNHAPSTHDRVMAEASGNVRPLLALGCGVQKSCLVRVSAGSVCASARIVYNGQSEERALRKLIVSRAAILCQDGIC